MPTATTKMSFDELVHEFEKNYQSRHYRQTGDEAYDFNIKVWKVHIPKIARHIYSETSIDERYEAFRNDTLETFIGDLKYDYPWISEIYIEGRSGGWLTVVTREEPAFVDGIRIGVPRKRIRDLRQIGKKVQDAKRDFVKVVESDDFWEVGPRDWSPRMKE